MAHQKKKKTSFSSLKQSRIEILNNPEFFTFPYDFSVKRKDWKRPTYQAKELPSSSKSESQNAHQSRLRAACSGRRGVGFLRKNLTSESFCWNRERKEERDLTWLGKYLCRRPWSWFSLQTLQNSNWSSVFFFFVLLLMELWFSVMAGLGLGFLLSGSFWLLLVEDAEVDEDHFGG